MNSARTPRFSVVQVRPPSFDSKVPTELIPASRWRGLRGSTRIEDEVIDGGARHIRTGHRPLPPIRGVEDETTFLRPDGHHDTAFLDCAGHTNHLQRWGEYARHPRA